MKQGSESKVRDRGKPQVQARQKEHSSSLVVKIGGMNPQLQYVTFRVDQILPFPSADLLAAIVATRAAGLGRLHGLKVNGGRRWLGLAATPGSILLAQRRVDLFPLPAFAPAAEAIVPVGPGWQIVGHHAPSDAATQHKQASVNDAPQVVFARRIRDARFS